VAVTEVLDVVAPTGTRHTLPEIPALPHAVESFTNSRYSVAKTLALAIANKHTPSIPLLKWTNPSLKIETMLNLHVALRNHMYEVWHV
jgi:hypothetical protein